MRHYLIASLRGCSTGCNPIRSIVVVSVACAWASGSSDSLRYFTRAAARDSLGQRMENFREQNAHAQGHLRSRTTDKKAAGERVMAQGTGRLKPHGRLARPSRVGHPPGEAAVQPMLLHCFAERHQHWISYQRGSITEELPTSLHFYGLYVVPH